MGNGQEQNSELQVLAEAKQIDSKRAKVSVREQMILLALREGATQLLHDIRDLLKEDLDEDRRREVVELMLIAQGLMCMDDPNAFSKVNVGQILRARKAVHEAANPLPKEFDEIVFEAEAE